MVHVTCPEVSSVTGSVLVRERISTPVGPKSSAVRAELPRHRRERANSNGSGFHLQKLSWSVLKTPVKKVHLSPESARRATVLQIFGCRFRRLRRAASSAPALAMSLRNSGES